MDTERIQAYGKSLSSIQHSTDQDMYVKKLPEAKGRNFCKDQKVRCLKLAQDRKSYLFPPARLDYS